MTRAAVLALFAVSQVEDIASTAYALGVPGLYEGNPVVAWWMVELGPAWWLPKIAIVLVSIAIARRARSVWPLGAAAALTFLVVLNNVARF